MSKSKIMPKEKNVILRIISGRESITYVGKRLEVKFSSV